MCCCCSVVENVSSPLGELVGLVLGIWLGAELDEGEELVTAPCKELGVALGLWLGRALEKSKVGPGLGNEVVGVGVISLVEKVTSRGMPPYLFFAGHTFKVMESDGKDSTSAAARLPEASSPARPYGGLYAVKTLLLLM